MKILLAALLAVFAIPAHAGGAGSLFNGSAAGNDAGQSISPATVTIPSGTGSACFSADNPTLAVNCANHTASAGGSGGLSVTYGVTASSGTFTSGASVSGGELVASASSSGGTSIQINQLGSAITPALAIDYATSGLYSIEGSPSYTVMSERGSSVMSWGSNGNVGIGNLAPVDALDVAGSVAVTGSFTASSGTFTNGVKAGNITSNGYATFSSSTNEVNPGAFLTNGTGSGTTTSFGGCASTITLTTHGGYVFTAFNGQGQSDTASDGCAIWILQDGAFINSESANIPLSSNQSGAAVVAQSQMLTYANFISVAPPAGAHSYCFGVGVTGGGTCSMAQKAYSQFSAVEFR